MGEEHKRNGPVQNEKRNYVILIASRVNENAPNLKGPNISLLSQRQH